MMLVPMQLHCTRHAYRKEDMEEEEEEQEEGKQGVGYGCSQL